MVNNVDLIKAAELLPCPFCGTVPSEDLRDTVYPSGTWWRETNGVRCYVSHKGRKDGDNQCWNILCNSSSGGCGVTIEADSEQEARAKWNTRAALSEASEKDCRTCKGFTLCLGITARHEPQACVNFSLYQEANADFKQLTQGAA